MQLGPTGSLGVETKPSQCGKPFSDEASQGVPAAVFDHARDVARIPVDLGVGGDLDGAGEERAGFGPALRRVVWIYVGVREEGDVARGDLVEEPGSNGGCDVRFEVFTDVPSRGGIAVKLPDHEPVGEVGELVNHHEASSTIAVLYDDPSGKIPVLGRGRTLLEALK